MSGSTPREQAWLDDKLLPAARAASREARAARPSPLTSRCGSPTPSDDAAGKNVASTNRMRSVSEGTPRADPERNATHRFDSRSMSAPMVGVRDRHESRVLQMLQDEKQLTNFETFHGWLEDLRMSQASMRRRNERRERASPLSGSPLSTPARKAALPPDMPSLPSAAGVPWLPGGPHGVRPTGGGSGLSSPAISSANHSSAASCPSSQLASPPLSPQAAPPGTSATTIQAPVSPLHSIHCTPARAGLAQARKKPANYEQIVRDCLAGRRAARGPRFLRQSYS